MRQGNRFGLLGIFSALSLLAAVTLFVIELVLYSRAFNAMPAGVSLGGVPVGGLSETAALNQLVTAYRTPLELRYLDQTILLDPTVAGFQVNGAVMVPEATQYRTAKGFWNGLWEFMWAQPGAVQDIPLRYTYSQDKLRAFLQDVALRYDQPGAPAQADPGTLGFKPGAPGYTLDIDAAVSAVDAGLRRPAERLVELPVVEQNLLRPTFDTLGQLIRDDVRQFQFSGIFSLYLADLKTGRELVINLSNGEDVPGPIAFSGMSTIKIPIMVAFFAQSEGGLTDDESLLLQRSIDESANTATDLLLKTVGTGDGLEGTRRLTADMQRLGLKNTFLSGLLDVFGAVLAPLSTPANGRTDLNTLPDPYNQTTAEDMGSLLVMVDQCAQAGGALLAAFPGQFTADECRKMIDLLSHNEVGPIFITGGSPGGVVAHKHGWDRLPLTNVADAALVFTPTGNYAMTVYVHQEATMGFDEANRLIISVARAVYNYFNPSNP